MIMLDGETMWQLIRVPITNDNILENDETFFGNLATTDGVVDLDPDQATVTIVEDPNDCMLL